MNSGINFSLIHSHQLVQEGLSNKQPIVNQAIRVKHSDQPSFNSGRCVKHQQAPEIFVTHYSQSNIANNQLPGSSISFGKSAMGCQLQLPSFKTLISTLNLDSQAPLTVDQKTEITWKVSPMDHVSTKSSIPNNMLGTHFGRVSNGLLSPPLHIPPKYSEHYHTTSYCATNPNTGPSHYSLRHQSHEIPQHRPNMIVHSYTLNLPQPQPNQVNGHFDSFKLSHKSGRAQSSRNHAHMYSPYPTTCVHKQPTPLSQQPEIIVSSSDSASSSINNEHTTKCSTRTKSKTSKKGVWSDEEHNLFLMGLENVGENWKLISDLYVKTRSRRQVASHAQKFLGRKI